MGGRTSSVDREATQSEVDKAIEEAEQSEEGSDEIIIAGNLREKTQQLVTHHRYFRSLKKEVNRRLLTV